MCSVGGSGSSRPDVSSCLGVVVAIGCLLESRPYVADVLAYAGGYTEPGTTRYGKVTDIRSDVLRVERYGR
jgi:hypothetical protein